MLAARFYGQKVRTGMLMAILLFQIASADVVLILLLIEYSYKRGSYYEL